MGNSNSPLMVDYAALNKSCEQIRNILPPQPVATDPDFGQPRMTTKKGRSSREESDIGWTSGTRSEESQLRAAQSLPNVCEDHGDDLDNHILSSTPRERCNTISQPIRIPVAGQSLLTVENVALQQELEQRKQNRGAQSIAQEAEVPCLDSPRRVELVKCDDIVIHFDSLQSPDPTASSSRATQSPLAMGSHDSHLYVPSSSTRLRIGSAPDFMDDLIPVKGEKIPQITRCRFLSGGDRGSPSYTAASSHLPEPSSFQRPRRGQTLISFLENFSSGDSDLEKENSHFSICQAVICALEQLRWRNEVKKWSTSQSQASTVSISSDLEDDDIDPADLSHDFDPELMSVSDVAPPGAAEWSKDTNSAEVCALSLLTRFNKLPKACDIHWEGFDQGCGSYSSSFYRGTNDWAPPRSQIIFTRNGVSNSNRKKTLQEQNYRCRGCGIQVSLEYSGTFRFCGYTNQYYCTACHRNQMSVIPARVLDDWDFKLYPVSIVAYRLLEEIWFSPLFNLSTIDPMIFKRRPVLQRARVLRFRLRLVRDHVTACRFYKREEMEVFQDIPDYFTSDIELWSMADLKAIKRGILKDYITLLIQRCDDHVQQCELCLARGYLCEICHKGAVLFPWQPPIKRCGACGGCIHEQCWKDSHECARCSRIRHRK